MVQALQRLLCVFQPEIYYIKGFALHSVQRTQGLTRWALILILKLQKFDNRPLSK
jgi:hypothetical protein